jgi:adenosylhomocysteine nucleosidase
MDSGTGDPVWHSDSPITGIAVIAALDLESRILKFAAGDNCPIVYVSGPGRAGAYAAAERAIAAGASALISFGLAGGLGPEASTGRLVLPTSVASVDGEWRSDAAWRNRLANVLEKECPSIDCLLYSADRVLTTRDEKASLRALSGACAVDMESAAIAKAATEAGVAFVALRVIADGPDDELPAKVEALVTEEGRTNYRAVVGFFVSPSQLRLLFGLAVKSRLARKQLTKVVRTLAGKPQ